MTAVALSERFDPALQTVLDRLRHFAPVERLILFGSRARGDHDQNSDWDLCVILPDDIPAGLYTPASMWETVRDVGLTIQVVPMRRSVFEERRHDLNALAHDVALEGIVLFEESPARHP